MAAVFIHQQRLRATTASSANCIINNYHHRRCRRCLSPRHHHQAESVSIKSSPSRIHMQHGISRRLQLRQERPQTGQPSPNDRNTLQSPERMDSWRLQCQSGLKSEGSWIRVKKHFRFFKANLPEIFGFSWTNFLKSGKNTRNFVKSHQLLYKLSYYNTIYDPPRFPTSPLRLPTSS